MQFAKPHSEILNISALIEASPSAKDSTSDQGKKDAALQIARAELKKRKREISEEAKRKRARDVGPFTDYLDFCFKIDGYAMSYGKPFNFSRSKKNRRVYNCSAKRLLTLENINCMKAHGIEHVILCQEGDFPLPYWWKETGMSFHQFPSVNPFTQTRCRRLLDENPGECILIAKAS